MHYPGTLAASRRSIPFMKTPAILLATSVLLCAGCVGSGPNTQQGAVTGGVLGAIAGAVIGNNSGGGGHGVGGAIIGAAAGAAVGGAVGNAEDHRRGTIYVSENEAVTPYVEREPPPLPPMRGEVVRERPRHEAVWIDGYWSYEGHGRYSWVEGYWATPPRNHRRYVQPHWSHRRNGYVYVQGYWQR